MFTISVPVEDVTHLVDESDVRIEAQGAELKIVSFDFVIFL